MTKHQQTELQILKQQWMPRQHQQHHSNWRNNLNITLDRLLKRVYYILYD